MIYQTVVALSLVAAASAAVYSSDATVQKSLFEDFKTKYGKRYETMEDETRRFYLFVENLKVADHRNIAEKKAGGTAVHGVTKFSDLSQAEFESSLLTSDPSMRSNKIPVTEITRPVDTKASLVDWTGVYTTAVKDQGYCGSCWAFSATSQIESDAIRAGKSSTGTALSPEQITQCDKTSLGCNGGWTEHAYQYVQRGGGLETDAAYPYTSYQGTTGSCSSDSSKFVVSISGYKTISGESAMASYVQSTGPLSVCLDAETWNSYTGGIMSVCGTTVDHCVQAVGVDASSGGYWKVRNSWNTNWGESGFIRLAYGANTCAITSDPTYVTF
jgi:C1A family cysteine protease